MIPNLASETTVMASVYYIGPEWAMGIADPETGRLGYILDDGYGWMSRGDAEAEAIRVATERGAACVQFRDVDRSAPPYRVVWL